MDEEEIWSPAPIKSGTIEAILIYKGRSKPIAVDDPEVEIVHWPPWMRYVTMEHDTSRTRPTNTTGLHSKTD